MTEILMARKDDVDAADALALKKADNLSDVADAASARSNIGLGSGDQADRPDAGTAGRIYFATDTEVVFYDTGAAWAILVDVATDRTNTFTPVQVFSAAPIATGHPLRFDELAENGGTIPETDRTNTFTPVQVFSAAPIATGHPLRHDELAANGGSIPEEDRTNTFTPVQVFSAAPIATGHPLRHDELAENGGSIPEEDRANTFTPAQVFSATPIATGHPLRFDELADNGGSIPEEDRANTFTGTNTFTPVQVFSAAPIATGHPLRFDELAANVGGTIPEVDRTNTFTPVQVFSASPAATGNPLRFDELAANGGSIPEEDRTNSFTGDNSFSGANTFSGINTFTPVQIFSASPSATGHPLRFDELAENGGSIPEEDRANTFTPAQVFSAAPTATGNPLRHDELAANGGTVPETDRANAFAAGQTQDGEPMLDESTSGVVIQRFFGASGAAITSSSIIPFDDTIPQITEGTQALSISFTPKRADSRLRISALLQIRGGAKALVKIATLHRGGVSDALAVTSSYVVEEADTAASDTSIDNLSVIADIVSPGTSSQTFSARFGPHATGSLHLNADDAGNRVFGDRASSIIEVMEYMP